MSAVTEIPASYLVTVSPDARYQIEEETTRRKFQLGDGYETGGGLFGSVDESNAVIEIATGPGEGFQPERGEFNRTFAEVLGDDEARILSDYICGSWHNHPHQEITEAPEPSDTDISHWRYLLNRPGYRGDAVVGLIVVEGRSSRWRTPRIFAWVTRHRDGETVCEKVGEIHS